MPGMNGRNYDLLLSRMTTIANRHEELKQQLEMMTHEEVRNILNERRNLKISTRLDNYEEALKLNPLETPKIITRRRPPEMIKKARDLKWSAVAFRSVILDSESLEDHQAAARDSSPSQPLEEDRRITRPGKSSSLAPANKHAQSFSKTKTSPQSTLLPPLLSVPTEHHPERSCTRRDVDLDRLHRTTTIESIRLQIQKEQLKKIQAKFDSIKAYPGYVPPATVVYSNPDEQLQAPWRSKALHARPARDKKPWALPENLRPRRKKKIEVVEMTAAEIKVEEAVVVAPVKSAMELMMDMDGEEEDESDERSSDTGLLPANNDHQEPTVLKEDANVERGHLGETPAAEVKRPQTTQAAAAAEVSHAPPPQLEEPERPITAASALSEVDSVFTRDSDALAGKKAIVLSGEATHAIIMSELPVSVDFEDILLEKVLSGEEINKISTSKGDKKPLRTGDLFLLGRFLKGDVMLVRESYQESESSGDEDDDCPIVVVGSRGNSRKGARSRGSKSRSRSRPTTQGGDAGFVMASDFVQVSVSE